MKEVGLVVGEKNGRALVKVSKKDECSKCGMCLFSEGADSTVFEAENPVNAKESDKVIIDVKGKGKLLASFLIFVVPLLIIGLSAIISLLIIKKEIWMLILSVFFIGLWYTLLGAIDKSLKNRSGYLPVIEKIIKENIENE